MYTIFWYNDHDGNVEWHRNSCEDSPIKCIGTVPRRSSYDDFDIISKKLKEEGITSRYFQFIRTDTPQYDLKLKKTVAVCKRKEEDPQDLLNRIVIARTNQAVYYLMQFHLAQINLCSEEHLKKQEKEAFVLDLRTFEFCKYVDFIENK